MSMHLVLRAVHNAASLPVPSGIITTTERPSIKEGPRRSRLLVMTGLQTGRKKFDVLALKSADIKSTQ